MRRSRRHSPRFPVHGILLLDKPAELSSNQALQLARGLLRAEKGGHTGALDPMATGLLPLCFGEATKLAGMLLGSRKAYRAECRLGVTTNTGDREGEVRLTRHVPELDEAAIEAALAPLRGRIQQMPPVYSALKQGGEPLYRKVRRGETVAVAAREVEIHRLDLLGRTADTLDLYVECGSGTYVRSIAVDLGETLGCGGHLTSLRRLWVAPFGSRQAMPVMIRLEELASRLASGGAPEAILLPMEVGVAHLPEIRLDSRQSHAVRRGQVLPWPDSVVPNAGLTAVFDENGRLLALVECAVDRRMKIARVFNHCSPVFRISHGFQDQDLLPPVPPS